MPRVEAHAKQMLLTPDQQAVIARYGIADFNALLRIAGEAVSRYTARRGISPRDRDELIFDVAADGFMGIWQERFCPDPLDPHEKALAKYFNGIAFRHLCSRWRQHKTQRMVIQVLSDLAEPGATPEGPLDAVLRNEPSELEVQILTIIECLPGTDRDLAIMRFFWQIPYRVLAETMDDSVGALTSRMSRIRSRILAELKESGVDTSAFVRQAKVG